MTTNINITVGDNALLDHAKQQQAANRQAQLNREASSRLEAEATAARTAALATQGRDANGNLITGAPFTQPQIDRRPAANRNRSVQLSLFYYNNENAEYLSGDGLLSVTMNAFTPVPVVYGDLEPIFPLTVSSDPSILDEYMAAAWSDSGITYLDPGFFTYDSFVETKDQIKRRYIYDSQGGAQWSFPLGDGSAIIIKYNYTSNASIITDYFVHAYYIERIRSAADGGSTFTDEIIDEDFFATTENSGTLLEQWEAVIVGDTVARSATVSNTLKDRLRTVGNQFTVKSFTQAPRGCRIQFPSPPTSLCIGQQTTAFFAQAIVNTYAVTIKATPRSGYGIVGAPGCSPAAWVALESEETALAMGQAETHEEFNAIPTIASLFRPRYYVAPLLEKPLSWSGPSLTGAIGIYPEYTNSQWKANVRLQTPLASIPLGFSKNIINDWGQKAYCSSQALIA